MDSSTQHTPDRNFNLISAALFIGIIVAISLGIGYLTQPGEWYDTLNKPFFNPPSWVFGPVWSVLYILIAIAGWRIWCKAPKSAAMKLWLAQMILNWIWSPAFFGAQAPKLAFIIIIAMVLTIYLFINRNWNSDRTSAYLFIPYAAWVTFATLLNGSIAILNP